MYCDFPKIQNFNLCRFNRKSENCIYNSAIYIECGKIINLHRKKNILKEAKKFYSCGKKIEVFNCKLGNCAISICSDNYKKSSIIPHVISRMQADIIISPSSWTIENDNIEESPYEYKWAETMEKVTNDYQNIFISATSVGYIVEVRLKEKNGWTFLGIQMEKNTSYENNEISEIQIIELIYQMNKEITVHKYQKKLILKYE